MSGPLRQHIIDVIAGSPEPCSHALATVGPEIFKEAVEKGQEKALIQVLELARRSRRLFYRDCLELIFYETVPAPQMLSIIAGKDETIHHPAVVRLAIRELGLERASRELSRSVGLDLDEESIRQLGSPERVFELLAAPLLKLGVTEEEAKFIFGTDYVMREQVDHGLVRRTWSFHLNSLAVEPELCYELVFEQGALVGWTDHSEAVGGRVGRIRPAKLGDVPPPIGGFDIAGLCVTMVAMDEADLGEEDIEEFMIKVVNAIRKRKPNWPTSELESLAPLSGVDGQQGILEQEAYVRLEHCQARFSGYDPDLMLVDPDKFGDRGLQVLRQMNCIRTPVLWGRAILLAVLFALAGLYIGLMAVSSESESQAQSVSPSEITAPQNTEAEGSP
ncbi:MAG: hypothetical protein VX938_13600 [Myxococcota bacterium]|nr:hypothetical protein [Myxococcota bacterium]